MAAVYVDTCAGIDPSCVAHEPTLTYAFFLVISTPTSTAQICPAVVALRSGASECIEINVNKYLQIFERNDSVRPNRTFWKRACRN